MRRASLSGKLTHAGGVPLTFEGEHTPSPAGEFQRTAKDLFAAGVANLHLEEALVAVGAVGTAPVKPKSPRAGGRRPQLDDMAASLSDHLDTRVTIALGQRKGKVVVEFASVEDLNRILDVIGVDRPKR